MRKVSIVLGTAWLLIGCTTQSGSLETLFAKYDDETENQSAPQVEFVEIEQVKPEEITVVQQASAQETISPAEASRQTAAPAAVYVEETNPNRFRYNVAIKAHNADFVSYEYKNIRIDELAALAIRYCDEQGGKKAYLRQIVLHQNHNRIATFDCKNLAMDQ